jgi:hypothetical protein
MSSRALIPATVMLLIGGFSAIPVRAENLEAGKSPSQIFTGTCLACHKGMRGLIKTVSPGSLPGFLRQHYTTSPEMAGQLSAYLLSNGASDARAGGGLTKQGRDVRSEPKPVSAPEEPEPRSGHRQRAAAPQGAEKPDSDGAAAAQGEPKGDLKGEAPGRSSRHAKRLARPGPEAPEADGPAVEGQPAAATSELGPGGRPLSAKHKLSKRGRPNRDGAPKGEVEKDETVKDEAAKAAAAKAEGSTRTDSAKPEAAKDEPSASSKGEPSGGETSLRADPVPAVSPAPKPSEDETRPTQMAAPSTAASTASISRSSGSASEPSAAPAPAAGLAPPPTDVSPPAAAPAGPPAPPISQ